ncbi:18797_t:CDS:2, partial [Gigaspora margarita]
MTSDQLIRVQPINHQHDHQHTLYPGTGPEIKQQIQEIAADYSSYPVISYTNHTVYIFQLLQQSTNPPREYFCALLYTCRYTANSGFETLANQLQQAYQQTNKFELDPFLVLYTQNTTTIAVENSDSDSDLELNRLFQTPSPTPIVQNMDDDLFCNPWTEHNPAVYLTNTLPDLDDWDKETPQVYAKKISKSGQTVGLEQTNLVLHEINTGNAKPISQRPYALSRLPEQQEVTVYYLGLETETIYDNHNYNYLFPKVYQE